MKQVKALHAEAGWLGRKSLDTKLKFLLLSFSPSEVSSHRLLCIWSRAGIVSKIWGGGRHQTRKHNLTYQNYRKIYTKVISYTKTYTVTLSTSLFITECQ